MIKIAFILLFQIACIANDALAESDMVTGVGSRLKILHHNDLTGQINLQSLKDKQHLYAIGPVAGLQGEITVYDSQLSIASIGTDEQITISESPDYEAIFLLYADVGNWHKVTIDKALNGLDEIEHFVRETAQSHNISIDQSFPFRLEGTPEFLEYHVIFKGSDKPHSHKEHMKSKKKFTLSNQASNIIGFWVTQENVGRFTHPGKRTHLHFKNINNTSSGHIDDIVIQSGTQLYLPEELN